MGTKYISKRELANELGISPDSLRRKIKEKGIRNDCRKLLTPVEADKIRKKLLLSQ